MAAERNPTIFPLFRVDTRTSKIVRWALLVVPLAFAIIGFFVPKEPSHVQSKSLNEVRFGEQPAPPR